MIITIDGPTASGKSTIAHMLADKLNFYYLNSGFLFRSLAYIFLYNKNIKLAEFSEINLDDTLRILDNLEYKYVDNTVYIFYLNKNITGYLKSALIDQAASIIANNINIRQALLDYQRKLAKEKNIVAEGRDSGTIVFNNARYKFFLTASPEVRAFRWQKAQNAKGHDFSLQESLNFMEQRDKRDSNRTIAPLIPAQDAIIIDSTNLSTEDILALILSYINQNN